jgi:hypothetical protein
MMSVTDHELEEASAVALYGVDHTAKGQWWHFVCAVEDANSGQLQYGIQCSSFKFGKREMSHIAITDVDRDIHHKMIRPLAYRPSFNGSIFNMKLDLGDATADLVLYPPPDNHMTRYPGKDVHCGYPSLLTMGYVNGVAVTGVGCFDREIFDKKMLPGEKGWVWTVAWLDNGSTQIDYAHFDDEAPYTRRMRHGPNANLEFQRVGPVQQWNKGQNLGFSYVEELCDVWGVDVDTNKCVEGRGYREIVGFNGAPRI